MTKQNIACCCFPSTALFIDDRKEYLNSLGLLLDPDIYYETYTDPEEAAKFLIQDYKPTPFIKKWVSNLKDKQIDLGKHLEENELTHSYTDIDISAIHQEIYSPDRFKEISLVVVDYSMPKMNGLELCNLLKNSPVKKLLVTGEAGYKLGVDALNSGIIDGYILKGEHDFDEQLHTKIRELQHTYFQDLSAGIMHNLAANSNSCLGDPVFINQFEYMRYIYNISEYYLVNDSGCFLFLTNDGKISWLVVKSEADMESCYNKAVDNDGPADIINAFKKRQQLLFHFTKEDAYADSIEDWRKHMHPATKLEGKNGNYYYAYLEGVSGYDVKHHKIATYNDYF